jgi:SAM-dependent methyltransferase
VLAVEPSAGMRAQRPAHVAPAIDASAEALPLDDDTFDAAMAIITLHHWRDPAAGQRELPPVARGPVVVLTFDIDVLARYWMISDAWIVEGERYRLDRSKVRIDLDQLDHLLASAEPGNEPRALEAALELWRRQPLEGSDYMGRRAHPPPTRHPHRANLSAPATPASNTATPAARANSPSKQSRSTSSTRRPGGWRSTPTTRSGCASPSHLAHALDEQLGLQPTRETRAMYPVATRARLVS